MKTLLILSIVLLLNLSACTKEAEKENPVMQLVLARALVVTQFPYPLAASCKNDSNSSKCSNHFNHSPVQCHIYAPERCKVEASVGVCILSAIGSVTEIVYYSDEFNAESAKKDCETLASSPANSQNKVEFQSTYRLDSVYSPK